MEDASNKIKNNSNNRLLALFLQFVKFGVVGVSNTVIWYVVYASLTYVGVHYILSNIISFFVSVSNSFFWNNRYVFKKYESEKRNPWWALLKTFVAYAGTGLVLSNLLLTLFVEVFKMSKFIAPILPLFITIPLNFVINKYWSFRSRKIIAEEKIDGNLTENSKEVCI